MDRRKFCAGLLSVPGMAAAARMRMPLLALPVPTPAVWDSLGEVRFVLQDRLEHPFYWWPRTLLGYPVQFRSPVNLKRLALTCVVSGERVPIQFSEVVREHGEVRSAMLHFSPTCPAGEGGSLF